MQPVTYCTNIHPGESWAEVRANIETFLPRVKQAVCPDAPYPVGLRLPGLASRELNREEALRFKAWMDAQGLYVATLNGFPYGTFHGRPVKQDVYLPDWREPERLAYTRRLADVLALWLPSGMKGSISTVPVVFGKPLSADALSQVRGNLLAALEHLAQIKERSGACIRLSLEPEPGCYVETTAELVALFAALELPLKLRGHLACCYDCCHQALQFENPQESLALLREHEIPVGHVQVSSALHLQGEDIACLERFVEPVYLHQAVARAGHDLQRFDDLPLALQKGCAAQTGSGADDQAWRVHFHLPVFVQELPECRTTQEFLTEVLPLFDEDTLLEVETYTWDVLPPDLRRLDLSESIIREIQWVEAARKGAAPEKS